MQAFWSTIFIQYSGLLYLLQMLNWQNERNVQKVQKCPKIHITNNIYKIAHWNESDHFQRTDSFKSDTQIINLTFHNLTKKLRMYQLGAVYFLTDNRSDAFISIFKNVLYPLRKYKNMFLTFNRSNPQMFRTLFVSCPV